MEKKQCPSPAEQQPGDHIGWVVDTEVDPRPGDGKRNDDSQHDAQFPPTAVQIPGDQDRNRQVDPGSLGGVLRGEAQRHQVCDVAEIWTRPRDDQLDK